LGNIINSGNFSDIKEDRIIRYTNALYNLLLTPVKQYLPDSGNLIFVIDSFFQNLPLSMLHDGKRYLIESYNISISTGSQFIPNSELNKDIKVLAGGISEVNPSFKSSIITHIFQPLPEVKEEIESIKKIVPTSILLNKDFTQENLKNKFQNEVLKIVHLSTHGQFSSDPEQTFILSWDSPLNISAIKNILENKRSIIDLLVLSACQTAKGDKNSLLGIAGITSQTGARSTLATLWVIESESTVKLMTEFYKSLKIGLPKAAALRKAQLALISDSKYSHPYYWAALVLVGSWV
jgi:CHAT domain-containing protein